MKSSSKPVTASSYVSDEDLIAIASKFSLENYRRPSEEKDKIKIVLKEKLCGKDVIFDTGCGVGESSYLLALENPDKVVLGVDKSVSRIERKNTFKQSLPGNLVLIQADLQDVWPALYELQEQGALKVCKQYILYPNPWPKLKGVKRRWYANPMLSFILGLNCVIEIRSNWKKYLEDSSTVVQHIAKRECAMEEFVPKGFLTPFERKYHLSSQSLYKLNISGEK